MPTTAWSASSPPTALQLTALVMSMTEKPSVPLNPQSTEPETLLAKMVREHDKRLRASGVTVNHFQIPTDRSNTAPLQTTFFPRRSQKTG